MFDDKHIVERILNQPSAVLIVQELQSKLEAEQGKRAEFYNLIDEDTKAEFINGEIVFHSPVLKRHTDATKYLLELLDIFVRMLKKGYVGVEKTLTKFTRNDYEPDICFFQEKKSSQFTDNQLIFPVPDFAIEVLSPSPESIHRDRKTKYHDYELHGVSEYWIVDPDEQVVEQYLLEGGKYKLVLKSGEGMIRSHAVPGFAIPIRAIFDEEENLKALAEMILKR